MTFPKPLRTALASGRLKPLDDLANLDADIIHVYMSRAGSLHWVLTHFAAAIAFVRTYFVRTDCSWRTPRAASRIPEFPREAGRMPQLRMMQSQEKPLPQLRGVTPVVQVPQAPPAPAPAQQP
jgi:hypothetical protein